MAVVHRNKFDLSLYRLPSYKKDKIRKEGGERAKWLKFVEEELIGQDRDDE